MTPRARLFAFSLALGFAVGGARLIGVVGGSDAHLPSPGPVGAAATVPPTVSAAGLPRLRTVPSHRPAGYRPLVDSGQRDHAGAPVLVACATCHATREPNRAQGLAGAVPRDFHQGLRYAHADQTCLSCHHADNADSLRLADGRALPFGEAQQLCAQCHGPQTRDYLHGSHGGMRGYWDEARGARTRNTCTDCHDPHAPAYPVWSPVFPPRDAGARQQAAREAAHAPTASTPPSHE